MSFKRKVVPDAFANGENLSQDLAGIGILVSAEANKYPNIENTLVAASIEGMSDLRTLSLVVDWLDIHSSRLNADRLIKLIKSTDSPKLKAFWKAFSQWKFKDERWKRLGKVYRGERLDLLPSGTTHLVKRHGEDERFTATSLRVPNLTLRHRPQDIMSPTELARHHNAYRLRVIMGPSFRADMWAELERAGRLPPSDLARRVFGSFATAWQVIHDWSLIHDSAGNPAGKSPKVSI